MCLHPNTYLPRKNFIFFLNFFLDTMQQQLKVNKERGRWRLTEGCCLGKGVWICRRQNGSVLLRAAKQRQLGDTALWY